MTEFDKIQRLMRLKRHERPQDMDAFVEQMVSKLHLREREDYLKKSAFSILWDRAVTWYNELSAPQLALATASALVLIGGMVMLLLPSGSSSSLEKQLAHKGKGTPVMLSPGAGIQAVSLGLSTQVNMGSVSDRELQRQLMSMHFQNGFVQDAIQNAAGEDIRTRILPAFTEQVEFKFEDDPMPDSNKAAGPPEN